MRMYAIGCLLLLVIALSSDHLIYHVYMFEIFLHLYSHRSTTDEEDKEAGDAVTRSSTVTTYTVY